MIFDLISLAVAVLWDVSLGEPSNAVHPVCWMGSFVDFLWRKRPGRCLFPYGCLVVLSGISLVMVVVSAVYSLSLVFSLPISVWFLKGTFSLSSLLEAGGSIDRALKSGDLSRGRRLLGYHLVSRDTSKLSSSEVAGAAIESLAENFGDGLVAPLFFFALFGLPGALVYRFVNTCDSMLGYRGGDFESGGKFAARLDDLLNWIPSRLASLLILAGAAILGANWRGGAISALRDHGRTSSPNAGWPMAAMAGVLSVVLDKRGVYRLNLSGRRPVSKDLREAMSILMVAQGLALASFFMWICAGAL
jgi:adenosylcobinamide-phosphate synthase